MKIKVFMFMTILFLTGMLAKEQTELDQLQAGMLDLAQQSAWAGCMGAINTHYIEKDNKYCVKIAAMVKDEIEDVFKNARHL